MAKSAKPAKRPRGIRVRDLPEQLGAGSGRQFLYCEHCGAENSAHRGDYFMADPDTVFACCGAPMRLVTARRVLTDVQRSRA